MITQNEYNTLLERNNKFEEMRSKMFPKQNSFSKEMILQITLRSGVEQLTNEERSKLEVYEFCHKPPENYILYINEKESIATTWMGEKLGKVIFGKEWKSNMGDVRISIVIKAINGKTYCGTYYKSSGDFAKIRLKK
jgi:hypothetical protein